MTRLLTRLLGRLPIGWLQLTHSKSRLAAAAAGVAFANVLVFVQLGLMGGMNTTIGDTYNVFDADILISSSDADTLTSGGNVARQHMFLALSVAGVADATPIFMNNATWAQEDGNESTFFVLGVDPRDRHFLAEDLQEKAGPLFLPNTAIIDTETRNTDTSAFASVSPGDPFKLELKGLALYAVDNITVGGSFNADGYLFVSDQTFLGLFENRISGAPDHIMIKVEEGVSPDVVVARLQNTLTSDTIKIQTFPDAIAADLRFQNTERPTGVIFGFGVFIGVLVGIVIVYQVLSTDVADHLKEYATFKAMGYAPPFFMGVVFEEAVILGIVGFIPGLVFTMLLYWALQAGTGLPIEMELGRALVVFFGTLAASTLSGAIATRRLTAADPADLF